MASLLATSGHHAPTGDIDSLLTSNPNLAVPRRRSRSHSAAAAVGRLITKSPAVGPPPPTTATPTATPTAVTTPRTGSLAARLTSFATRRRSNSSLAAVNYAFGPGGTESEIPLPPEDSLPSSHLPQILTGACEDFDELARIGSVGRSSGRGAGNVDCPDPVEVPSSDFNGVVELGLGREDVADYSTGTESHRFATGDRGEAATQDAQGADAVRPSDIDAVCSLDPGSADLAPRSLHHPVEDFDALLRFADGGGARRRDGETLPRGSPYAPTLDFSSPSPVRRQLGSTAPRAISALSLSGAEGDEGSRALGVFAAWRSVPEQIGTTNGRWIYDDGRGTDIHGLLHIGLGAEASTTDESGAGDGGDADPALDIEGLIGIGDGSTPPSIPTMPREPPPLRASLRALSEMALSPGARSTGALTRSTGALRTAASESRVSFTDGIQGGVHEPGPGARAAPRAPMLTSMGSIDIDDVTAEGAGMGAPSTLMAAAAVTKSGEALTSVSGRVIKTGSMVEDDARAIAVSTPDAGPPAMSTPSARTGRRLTSLDIEHFIGIAEEARGGSRLEARRQEVNDGEDAAGRAHGSLSEEGGSSLCARPDSVGSQSPILKPAIDQRLE
ncbi:hypothetical protein BDK51DRAFT_44042 [Blyttiomyces helicus]|uniref:Uncharacterized protein n=1 Tax=Blyttiomyces helicus TaxID=388810 RepID=A0A4P9W7D0_9FUNG|nr:hypothetical protein BDK51DRAFT_44042 [Blyttiomyces helicus]|eukprot:RKO87285.1 hypothetical protein BDK51DRAFT_44042 [Blyttiomyces helicus]